MPAPVQVRVGERGEPVAVRRARWLSFRPVARVQDIWEFEDGWWRETPTQRRYYQLVLADGTLLAIFRDLVANTWFEQHVPED